MLFWSLVNQHLLLPNRSRAECLGFLCEFSLRLMSPLVIVNSPSCAIPLLDCVAHSHIPESCIERLFPWCIYSPALQSHFASSLYVFPLFSDSCYSVAFLWFMLFCNPMFLLPGILCFSPVSLVSCFPVYFFICCCLAQWFPNGVPRHTGVPWEESRCAVGFWDSCCLIT